jgi:hypothetical protein
MAPPARRTVNGGLDDNEAIEEAITANMPAGEHASGRAELRAIRSLSSAACLSFLYSPRYLGTTF